MKYFLSLLFLLVSLSPSLAQQVETPREFSEMLKTMDRLGKVMPILVAWSDDYASMDSVLIVLGTHFDKKVTQLVLCPEGGKEGDCTILFNGKLTKGEIVWKFWPLDRSVDQWLGFFNDQADRPYYLKIKKLHVEIGRKV